MCLYLMPQNKNKKKYKLTAPKSPFMKELNKEGKVICYKVYRRRKSCLDTLYFGISSITEPGIVTSNRPDKRLTNCEKVSWQVHKGIHVYTTLTEAMIYERANFSTIPVTVYKKDLIAQGQNEQATFMNITIEKNTWDKAFGYE